MDKKITNAMDAERARREAQAREQIELTIGWILRNSDRYTREQLEAMTAPELKSTEYQIREASESRREIPKATDEEKAAREAAAARFRARFGGESKMVIKSKKRK